MIPLFFEYSYTKTVNPNSNFSISGYVTNNVNSLHRVQQFVAQTLKAREKVSNILRGKVKTTSLGLAKEFEQYIPYLLTIMHLVDIYPNFQIQHLQFYWKSALLSEQKAGILAKPKRIYFSSSSICFECIMVLYTYAYLLVNIAGELIISNSEANNNNITEEHLQIPLSTHTSFLENQKEAVHYYRKAAGIFHSIVKEYIPKYGAPMIVEHTHLQQLPELNSIAAQSLFKFSCSCAQMISIDNAIEMNHSSHVIAKLCIEVFKYQDTAHMLVNDLITQMRFKDSNVEFDEFYRLYIVEYRILYRGLTLKYLALDAYNNDKVGIAVAFVKTAYKQLREMKYLKDYQKENPFVTQVKTLLKDVILLEAKYEKENRMVFREKIPESNELVLPQGKMLMSPLEFDMQPKETIV